MERVADGRPLTIFFPALCRGWVEGVSSWGGGRAAFEICQAVVSGFGGFIGALLAVGSGA